MAFFSREHEQEVSVALRDPRADEARRRYVASLASLGLSKSEEDPCWRRFPPKMARLLLEPAGEGFVETDGARAAEREGVLEVLRAQRLAQDVADRGRDEPIPSELRRSEERRRKPRLDNVVSLLKAADEREAEIARLRAQRDERRGHGVERALSR